MFRRVFFAVLCAGVLLWSLCLPGTHQGALGELTLSGQNPAAYTPARIQTAYHIGPLYARGLNGAGQTVALIELDKFSASDLAVFDQRYGLPPIVPKVAFAGGTPFPTTRGAETSLDVEWLHAMAPAAAIQIYYVDDTGSLPRAWRSMAHALRAAANNGANVVSISIAACRPGKGLTATQNALRELLARGVSVFVSSGDYGALPGPRQECGARLGVSYPGGDPSVVSVGGTSLRLRIDDTISREVAWKLSGGGQFRGLPRASWATAPTMPNDSFRWVPDVAFLGDPGTGVSFVRNGTWRVAAGTSLGAPVWSAIWALVRQDALSEGRTPDVASRDIYRIGNSPQYHIGFHDIVQGSNGRYRAGPGWDAVTGWGTPDVSGLADSVVKLSAAHP